jgi:TMEM175 potassium channel family protein
MQPSESASPFEPHAGNTDLAIGRVASFSDGVFAIAATLLALEIALPAASGRLSNLELFHVLLSLWPRYLAYVISFLVIGAMWLGHHRKFQVIIRTDRTFLTINLLFLMFVAFIPFPTAVLSESGNRTATIFYAGSMIVASCLSALMWVYAVGNRRLSRSDIDPKIIRRETLQLFLTPAVFTASIGFAFIDESLAKASWALISIVSPFLR